MSQQKVLVLVGDAAEELDAMYPIYRLREAGTSPTWPRSRATSSS